MQLSENPLVNRLFFIALVSLIACGGYLWYASTLSARVMPPGPITYSQEHGVGFCFENTLYRTDIDGNLIEKKSYAELGLDPIIGDIDFGPDALYVTEGGTHEVKRCSLPLSHCDTFATIPGLHNIEPVKLAIASDAQRFYVSVSNYHRIDAFDGTGAFLYTLSGESLRYPNDIELYDDTTLLVADTNHFRIAALSLKDTPNVSKLWQIRLGTKLAGTEPHSKNWPTSFAVDANQQLWIVAQDGFFDDSKLLISTPLTALPDGEDPEILRSVEVFSAKPKQVVAAGTTVFFVDEEHFKIRRVSQLPGEELHYGDTFIASLFDDALERKEHWEQQTWMAQLGVILSLLLLIAAAVIEFVSAKDRSKLFSKPRTFETGITLDAEQHIAPDHHGIIWLHIKPALFKKFKLFAYILIGTLTLLCISLLFVDRAFDAVFYLLIGTIIGVGFLAGWMLLYVVPKQRVGTDNRRIYIVDVLGRQRDLPASECIFTGQRLLIDGVAIGLRMNDGQSFFDEAQLSAYILPLLETSQQRTEGELLLENISRFDAKTWAIIVLLISVMVIYTYIFI